MSGREALRSRRMRLLTAGAILGYGAVEALVVHRVARFHELGFGLATVTAWAAVSGLTLPGRFLLPVLARRAGPTQVFAAVYGVLALSAALMIGGDAYWQMALSFVLFGLVFGSALPLRAVVMGEWTPAAVFGAVMGAQAAMIAGARGRAGARARGQAPGLRRGDVCALLIAAAALVYASGRTRDIRP